MSVQVASLQGLGLNIRRAKLQAGTEHKFYITDARTCDQRFKLQCIVHTQRRQQWPTAAAYVQHTLGCSVFPFISSGLLAMLVTNSHHTPPRSLCRYQREGGKERQAGGDPAHHSAKHAGLPPRERRAAGVGHRGRSRRLFHRSETGGPHPTAGGPQVSSSINPCKGPKPHPCH